MTFKLKLQFFELLFLTKIDLAFVIFKGQTEGETPENFELIEKIF